VKVFPNPSSDFWVIQSENDTIENVVLTDLTGKTIYTWNGMQNSIHIPSNQLNAGMYIARISANQTEEIVKLIKK
jgi:23S rRNA maturation-related 3'-5' exoribonuclease YhaM